jgi:hypothetical protein
MAMFDMLDFIIKTNNTRISFEETPMGRILIEKHGFTEEKLRRLKDDPIGYLKRRGKLKHLVYFTEEIYGKTISDSAKIFKKIIME